MRRSSVVWHACRTRQSVRTLCRKWNVYAGHQEYDTRDVFNNVYWEMATSTAKRRDPSLYELYVHPLISYIVCKLLILCGQLLSGDGKLVDLLKSAFGNGFGFAKGSPEPETSTTFGEDGEVDTESRDKVNPLHTEDNHSRSCRKASGHNDILEEIRQKFKEDMRVDSRDRSRASLSRMSSITTQLSNGSRRHSLQGLTPTVMAPPSTPPRPRLPELGRRSNTLSNRNVASRSSSGDSSWEFVCLDEKGVPGHPKSVSSLQKSTSNTSSCCSCQSFEFL